MPGRASSLEELGLPGERGGFFSGNGAMSVLQGTTLRKSETALKIGTKPVKMLLKSPKAQKGMAFHSCVGMVITFTCCSEHGFWDSDKQMSIPLIESGSGDAILD